MKRIGVLYDNISGNVGDAAIGLSLGSVLKELRVESVELVPGRFRTKDYKMLIIGGGHLLRPSPDFFYDKFKVPGGHILNSCGILGDPSDLQYLDHYKYLSVRSSGDKRKLHYLKSPVQVVPCTSMLLHDIKRFDFEVKKPSIGIHVMPNFVGIHQETSFVNWLFSLGLNVYFVPITHYNFDFLYLGRLHSIVRDSTIVPILKAEELFTLIGRFDYFISSSLHGAMFAYVHKVPFVVWDSEKMRFFMEDRALEKYLFSDFEGMKCAFERLLKERPDYSENLRSDFGLLREHVEQMKNILSESESRGGPAEYERKARGIIHESGAQAHYLELQVIELNAELVKLRDSLQSRDAELVKLRDSLQSRDAEILEIRRSLTWGLLEKLKHIEARLLPPSSWGGRVFRRILESLRAAIRGNHC